MAELPLRLLKRLSWSFSEPIVHTPEEFVRSAQRYANAIKAPDPCDALGQPLPFSDVYLLIEHQIQAKNGRWTSKPYAIRIEATPGHLLTGAQLLYELHLACHGLVGQSDHRFFEGLALVSEATADAPAVYEVILGS